MSAPQLAEIALWLAVGAAFGAAYLWLVGRSVAALTGAGARMALLYLGLRVALAAAVLWFAANQGAASLIALLLGFLLARTIILRKVRRIDDGN